MSGRPFTRFAACVLVFVFVGAALSRGAARAQDAAAEGEKELRRRPVVETHADRIPKTKTGGNVLIRNATVLTVSRGTLPGTSVLVRGGKIAAIGADLLPDAGMAVIDGTGLYLSPGIVDCHAHVAVDGGLNEGAVSISAEVRVRDVVTPDDLAVYQALSGGCTAANVLHGSANVIGGQNATVKMKYRGTIDEMLFPGAPKGIKFALGENPKRSNGDGNTDRYPGSRLGVEAALRRAFTRARDYIAEWEEYGRRAASDPSALAPRRDVRLETLAGILKGDILVHSHCYRADEILMLLRVAEEFGFRVATLQHVLEGYKVAHEIAAHGAGASTFSDFWSYKMEAFDAIPYNAALMTRAGVNVSINSDSNSVMRWLNYEAAKTMKYGDLTEEEALKLVTLNPAWQLGIDSRVGSIDVGKDADLVLWRNHPLSITSHAMFTLVDGEVMFERDPARDEPAPRGGLPAPSVASGAPQEGGHLKPIGSIGGALADAAGEAVGAPDAPAWKPLEPAAPVRVAPANPSEDVVAILGGDVYPVSRGPIRGGTVLLRNGRIEAAGARDEVVVPAGARVVDAAGLRVYPGLIDAFGEVGLTEIGSVGGTLDTRELGDFNPNLKAEIAINPSSSHIAVTRVNGVAAAVTVPKGGVIAGQAGLVQLDGWTWEEMTLRSGIALQVNFPRGGPGGGRRGGRGGRGGAPDPEAARKAREKRLEELSGYVDRAKRYHGLKADAARLGAPAPELDLRLEAMAPFLSGERPVLFEVDSPEDIKSAVEFAEKHALRPVIVGGTEAWKVAEFLAAKEVPVVVGPILPMTFGRLPRDEHDPYDAHFTNPARLHDAGVRIAFRSNDSANARNLPYQAGVSISFGLDPDAALRAVTLGTAEILGVAGDLGSLDAGKIANVVVTDGDILELKTRVRGLFIAGREVPLESRHTRFYEQYKDRPVPAYLRPRLEETLSSAAAGRRAGEVPAKRSEPAEAAPAGAGSGSRR